MKIIPFTDYCACKSTAKMRLIQLMRSNGYLDWDKEIFDYYYVDYPYESNSFILVTDNNNIVGHLGFIQVKIKNQNVKACWLLHALIDSKYRNLSNFIALVRFSEKELIRNSYQLMLAMPNSAAANIYQMCLQWRDIGYINFSLSHKIPKDLSPQDRPLSIMKDDNYWKWRLNLNSPPSLVSQIYRWKNIDLQQILYINPGKIQADMSFHLSSKLPICSWRHDEYTNNQTWWGCRFMHKLIDNSIEFNFGDINLWHLDMIDSDAFRPHKLTIL